MRSQENFPFTAIIGQEKSKKGLLLTLINRNIGGCILSGHKGTAKSSIIRGLFDVLENTHVIDLPLHTTEEQVIGGMDTEKTVKSGEVTIQKGLLARAHQQVLYVDEINLLSDSVLTHIISALDFKEVTMARDGVSHVTDSDFILFGTMNPQEGMLSQKAIDNIGIYVEVESEPSIEMRTEIVKRRLAFERDPKDFISEYEKETETLKEQLKKARKLLPDVEVDANIEKVAVSLAIEAQCAGHRADFFLIEVAKACAALEGVEKVRMPHLQEAAEFVLPQRMRDLPEQAPQTDQEQEEQTEQEENGENEFPPQEEQEQSADTPPEQDGPQAPPLDDMPDNDDESREDDESVIPETVEAAASKIALSLLEKNTKKDRQVREGSGKRTHTKTSENAGRYIKHTLPKGKTNDIALPATIKAAAPYQRFRDKAGMAIRVESSDIRKKVREKRTGHMILFVIDASGSMGVKKRMSTVKSAIFSLLEEAYQKRDKVGLITFRKNSAAVLLEPTRSIEYARKALQDLPTGGNTPLADGLETTLTLLDNSRRKDPDYSPFIVLVTDGRANSTDNHKAHWQHSLELCDKLYETGAGCMVVDSEAGLIKLRFAEKLAERLDSSYYKLPNINDSNVMVDQIKANLN